MIDLSKGSIYLDGTETSIRHWQVWFLTPVGIIERRQDAVAKCVELDLNPLMIRPIPVAIDKDGRFEPVLL